MLQSMIAALEQLLEVQDLSVIEQTERLERERQSRSASCSIRQRGNLRSRPGGIISDCVQIAVPIELWMLTRRWTAT